MPVVQRPAQDGVHVTGRAGKTLRARLLDHLDSRQRDRVAPKRRDRRLDENPTPVGLPRDRFDLFNDVSEITHPEPCQSQVCARLTCMFLPGFLPVAVLTPHVRAHCEI